MNRLYANFESSVPSISTSLDPTITWGNVLFVFVAVAAADVGVYQSGGGYSGWACLFIGLLLCATLGLMRKGGLSRYLDVANIHGPQELSRMETKVARAFFLFLVTLGIVALVLNGNWVICVGIILWLVLLSMCGSGLRASGLRLLTANLSLLIAPLLSILDSRCRTISNGVESNEELVGASDSLPSASDHDDASEIAVRPSKTKRRVSPLITLLEVGIPCVVGIAFMAIFLRATPALADWFQAYLSMPLQWLANWAADFSIGEIFIWVVIGSVGFGLGANSAASFILENGLSVSRGPCQELQPSEIIFRIARNTLFVSIATFIFFLITECLQVVRGGLPLQMQYPEYVHQGAAWLTVALAFSTLVVCVCFRASHAQSQEYARLRPIGFLFIGLNFLLAIAIYRRLGEYIGQHGLTYLKLVGVAGVTCVVGGLFCVLQKIRHGLHVWWLLRVQSLFAAVVMFLFACSPIDWIAQSYNTNLWRAGRLGSTKVLATQQVDDFGLQAAWMLLESENPVIRRGFEAVLAKRLEAMKRGEISAWQSFQIGTAMLRMKIRQTSGLQERIQSLSGREITDAVDAWTQLEMVQVEEAASTAVESE